MVRLHRDGGAITISFAYITTTAGVLSPFYVKDAEGPSEYPTSRCSLSQASCPLQAVDNLQWDAVVSDPRVLKGIDEKAT